MAKEFRAFSNLVSDPEFLRRTSLRRRMNGERLYRAETTRQHISKLYSSCLNCLHWVRLIQGSCSNVYPSRRIFDQLGSLWDLPSSKSKTLHLETTVTQSNTDQQTVSQQIASQHIASQQTGSQHTASQQTPPHHISQVSRPQASEPQASK